MQEDNRTKIIQRYDEVAALLMDPALMKNLSRYQEAVREHAELEPIITAIRASEQAERELCEARELFENSQEQEIKELAREEIHDLEIKHQQLEQELERLLAPKDPRDDKNIIMEIRAGAGGEEAALFAAVLYRMYTAFAAAKGFKSEVIDSSETELGGCKEIVFEVTGRGAYSQFKYESGVHRVQRVPVTESGGRIHTSTCTVAVMPEAEDVDVDINPNDLQIDTYRASGAGGQHVNKTSSAIRVTHLPTGMVVTCQDERSQYKNKDRALKVLRSRLLDKANREARASEASLRRDQVGTGDRSERIRTYNYHQGRVTDHRIGLTLYKIDEILAGDLDELVQALAEAERSRQLAQEGKTLAD